MNAAQNIERNQFNVVGLYDTSLGGSLTYPKAQSLHQIIQDKDHWILITSRNSPHTLTPTVRVYDSYFQGKLSAAVQKQAAAILQTEAAEIILNVCSSSLPRRRVECMHLPFWWILCLELILPK